MSRKNIVDVIDQLIGEQKKNDLKNAIDDYTKEVRNEGAPLAKAAPAPAPAMPKPKMSSIKPPAMPKTQPQVMAKIDPKTHLPGTMLDKTTEGGNTMGTSLMTMTPTATLKTSPDMAPPMAASEGAKASVAQKMSKCMKSLAAAEKGVHTSGGFSGLEEKGQSQAGRLIERAKEPQSNKHLNDLYHERGKHMHSQKLAELKDMPKPNLPKSEMMKDDMAHPAGSPQDKAHDIAEESQSVQAAAQDLGSKPEIKKMFEHLRSKRSNPNWERSPANQAAGMEKAEEPKEISKDAENAIVASADKPMKIQEERPGQANEPKADKKI